MESAHIFQFPQWQQHETVTVLYSQDIAIITGCAASPDNRFNLHIQIQNNIIDLRFGEDTNGEKANHCTFLCTDSTSNVFFEIGALDNNSLWCLHVLGFKLYVN